jgi:hypothetical protein
VSGTLLSIMMLAVFALTGGAFFLFRNRRDIGKAWLMLTAALVLLLNVLLLAI